MKTTLLTVVFVLLLGHTCSGVVLDLNVAWFGVVQSYDTRPPLDIFEIDSGGLSSQVFGTGSDSVRIDLDTISAYSAAGWTISAWNIYAETYVFNEIGIEGRTHSTSRMDVDFTLAQTTDAILDFERTNPDVTIGASLKLLNDVIWSATVTDTGVPLTLEPGSYKFSWFAEAIQGQTHSDLTTGRISFIPEPSALTLAAFALLGLAYARRKQR